MLNLLPFSLKSFKILMHSACVQRFYFQRIQKSYDRYGVLFDPQCHRVDVRFERKFRGQGLFPCSYIHTNMSIKYQILILI